jgi:hypothetical protein
MYTEADYQKIVKSDLKYKIKSKDIKPDEYEIFSLPLEFNATPVGRLPLKSIYGKSKDCNECKNMVKFNNKYN